ncbi:MAG: hypothetical protein WBQ73_01450 [Candidatus Babeliales bacterium]
MIIEVSLLCHYLSIAFILGLNALGVGIGEGIVSKAGLTAINIQPSALNDIRYVLLFGSALIETAAIIGLSVGTLLFFSFYENDSSYIYLCELGIASALALSGICISIVSSFAIKETCFAIARQPLFTTPLFHFMLITQSIIQTPIIFSLIIAMFIRNQSLYVTSLAHSIKLIASGLCMGLGSIGPSIGLAHFARIACRTIGRNKYAYERILLFTFISGAIIETPAIFSLLVSLFLLLLDIPNEQPMLAAIAMFSAALCTGLGTIGTGIGSGRTAAAACEQIGNNKNSYALLSRTSMFAQGLIDTGVIYALIISLLLMFIWHLPA